MDDCHSLWQKKGNDYGYAYPEAIQIKGSLCHLKTAWFLWPKSYALWLLCQWFLVQLSPCHLLQKFFFFTFFQA